MPCLCIKTQQKNKQYGNNFFQNQLAKLVNIIGELNLFYKDDLRCKLGVRPYLTSHLV